MGFYQVDGGERVYLYSPRDSDLTLLPWNDQLLKNTIREQLVSQRPTFFSNKKYTRLCKDKAYDIWEKEHIAPFKIKGRFTGLLGDHPAEIYTKFSPYIRGSFTNCEIHKKNYNSYIEYEKLLRQAYPNQEFRARRTNILTYLETLCSPDHSLVDLDMMWGLKRKDLIKQICRALDTSLAARSAVMLWHCIGRTCGTDADLNSIYRPRLKDTISQNFNILKHTRYDYWEGFPMRVDMFTLERRAG